MTARRASRATRSAAAAPHACVWSAADGRLLESASDGDQLVDTAAAGGGGADEPAAPASHALADGSLLRWPWHSYTCAVGWRARTDAAAHDGSTPLHFAAHGQGRAEAAAALLRHGTPAPHTTSGP